MRAACGAFMWLAAGLSLTSRFARADMEPVPLQLLVDRSDLICEAVVVDVAASSLPERRTATAMVNGRPLKGTVHGQRLRIVFVSTELMPAPAPVRLAAGERYLLFLRREGDHHVLADNWHGAIPFDDLDKPPTSAGTALLYNADVTLRTAILEAVARDNTLEVAFRFVKLDLRVWPERVRVGQHPALCFRAANTGDREVSIKAEVLGDDGLLVMKGWTHLRLERDGTGYWTRLGGAQYDRARTTTLPPGEVCEWTTEFRWADYGTKPGMYSLSWQFGKAKSNTVSFEVLEVDREEGERTGNHTRVVPAAGRGRATSRARPEPSPARQDDTWSTYLNVSAGVITVLVAGGSWLLLRRRPRSTAKE